MKIFLGLALVSVTLVAGASAYGYKLNRNPYSGECRLQLNLPGTGIKDAYGGPMSTRYGGNDGKYNAYQHGSGNYHGAATSHVSSVAGHHGTGGIFSAVHTRPVLVPVVPIKNYGGGVGSSYGSGSYGSDSSNYGSSSSNYDRESSYGSSGSASNSYGSGSSSSNYGNNNYQPVPAPNYGGAGGSNYEDNYNSNKNYGSSSSSSGSKYASSSSSGNRGSYGENRDRDRETDYESNYASSASSTNNRGTYGGNRDRDYDKRPSGGSYGGSSDYERDRESSYESSSSSSKYGSSSSSGSRGSGSSYGSGSADRDDYRPSSSGGSKYGSSSSESSRGSSSSSSSYGGSSSAESYGNRRNQDSYNQASQDEYIDRRFANQVLEGHNSYRSRHTTPPVVLDEKMSLKAQEWAYELAQGRVAYGHSPDAQEGIYGENLHIVNFPSPTGDDIVDAWYREKKNYDYRDPLLVKSPRSLRNSHFTAMLWKSSRKIGVGKATANDGRTFVVVNYWPVGNIVDVLEDNVLPSRTDLGSTKGGIY